MFRSSSSRRSIRAVLGDKAGSSIAESLGGVAIFLIIAAVIGTAVTQDMKAVTTVATKAERQDLVTALVGDKRAVADWGTPSAPKTATVQTPNGNNVKVTTWRETTPVSTTLTAVTPASDGPDAPDCSGPFAVAKKGCVYATRLHAGDLDSLEPVAVVRKDPSMGSGRPVGTVDSRVSTSSAIPAGTTFASGSDSSASIWRYLINARSLEDGGEIRIAQAGRTVAVIPIDTTDHNYFGTFSGDSNVPITATVTAGNAYVKTVFIYQAGNLE